MLWLVHPNGGQSATVDGPIFASMNKLSLRVHADFIVPTLNKEPQMRILLVEDEGKLSSFIKRGLVVVRGRCRQR